MNYSSILHFSKKIFFKCLFPLRQLIWLLEQYTVISRWVRGELPTPKVIYLHYVKV